MAPSDLGNKFCSNCGLLKTLREFHKNKSDKVSGRQSWCIACVREVMASRYNLRSKAKVTATHKVCSTCLVNKPTEDFYRNSHNADLLDSRCISCQVERQTVRNRERYHGDHAFKLLRCIRSRTNSYFKKIKVLKDLSTMTELGITLETMFKWFEYQASLTGLDLSASGIQNDHVIPLDSLDPANSALDKKFCYNAVNMRPLSSSDNQSKSNKIIREAIVQQVDRATDFVKQLEGDELVNFKRSLTQYKLKLMSMNMFLI